MNHPYKTLPATAFWRSGVSELSALEYEGIYTPRFQISRETTIAAAGSCFAQHIGHQFKARGYSFLDLEPPPPLISPKDYQQFGFDLYSARYGNIYSIRQLLQLFQRATGEFDPEEVVWQDGDRFYDPFRPSIEPDGFASREELEKDGAFHLSQVGKLLSEADLFVFTFGLTEGWINKRDGAVLPSCPGTIAGEFDADKYAFHNFSYEEVLADAEAFIRMTREFNPNMRFLVTVSPVPLTATASGQHVLPATVYSKSVLRAVCGALYEKYPQLDYFPSYELVASHPLRAMFFNPNLRTVSSVGVEHVMNTFFSALEGGEKSGRKKQESSPKGRPSESRRADDDVACDDEVLEIFGARFVK